MLIPISKQSVINIQVLIFIKIVQQIDILKYVTNVLKILIWITYYIFIIKHLSSRAMNRERGPIDYSAYQQSFNSRCIQWRSEPVEQRKFNDPFCVPVLVIIIVGFLGIGGYYINDYNSNWSQNLKQGDQLNIQQYAPEIAACLGVSVALSFLYIFLLKMFPKIMVYTMIALTLGLLAILALAGLITGQIAITISMGFTLLIYGLVLYCFRRKIQTGIVLIKVATNFMANRPSIFITPFIKVILSIIIGIFWLFSISVMIYISNKQSEMGEDPTTVNVLTGFLFLFWLFFLFFLYYMMVFTIAVSCAFWYYGVQKNAFVAAYKWMFFNHLGSLTFAALVIAVITFIRMLADGGKRNRKNPCLAVCACIMACFLRYIEALLKILNHNAIIVMAVTGESYIDSAKTTIGLLCQNLPLLAISNMISGYLVFWGIIFTAGIPCILAFFMVGSQNPDTIIVVILVALFSITVSTMVLSVLAQAVGSVYIFYCFDKKFKEQGYNVNNMPNQIHQQLNGFKNYSQKDQSYDRF